MFLKMQYFSYCCMTIFLRRRLTYMQSIICTLLFAFIKSNYFSCLVQIYINYKTTSTDFYFKYEKKNCVTFNYQLVYFTEEQNSIVELHILFRLNSVSTLLKVLYISNCHNANRKLTSFLLFLFWKNYQQQWAFEKKEKKNISITKT